MKTKALLLSLIIVAVAVSGNAQQTTALKVSSTNKSFHKAYTPSAAVNNSGKEVKNVILMIGDGMGTAQLESGLLQNKGELTITNLTTCGFVLTQAYGKDFTTDSAASGTAYACGVKTYNAAIGVDKDTVKVANIPEVVAPKGYVCGVVTTDELYGATPSAFYAHQKHRNMSAQILGDLPQSQLSYVAGGSKEQVDKLTPDLWSKLKRSGYTVVNDVAKGSILKENKVAVIPPKAIASSFVTDGRGDFLSQSTKEALEFLSSKKAKGFFLMVEGARIDKAAHENDFESMVAEVLDFDKAVEEAIRFAEKDGNTIVIISADHETGGLTFSNGDINRSKLSAVFASRGHTGVMVPLFAYGPQAYLFGGLQHNSDVSNKIKSLLK